MIKITIRVMIKVTTGITIKTVQGGEHIHKYTETRTEPTCETVGSILYECACGTSYSESITVLGHDWVTHPEEAATCTKNGWTSYKQCSRCNGYENDYKGETITKLSHDWVTYPEEAATCMKSGWTSYKQCSRCNGYENDYKGEVITKLSHDWVTYPEEAATCTKSGRTSYKQCSKCNGYENDYKGEVITKLGHDISDTGCRRCSLETATGLNYTLSEDGTYYIVSGIGSETRTAFIIPSSYNGLPVKEIGYQALGNCKDITEVVLQRGITKIGSFAFRGCESLAEITIPNGVTSIGECAFVWTALEEIVLPSSIESIGSKAFSALNSLKSIRMDGDGEYYRVVDNCLIEIATKTLLKGTENSIIPADGSVTAIGAEAFNYCRGLNGIVIPDGVTSIGDNAFFECSGLESITLPSSLTTIGEQAFVCTKLSEIVLGEAVTTVGVRAFSNCYKLKNVTLPESLTNLQNQILQSCYALERIIFTGTGEQWMSMPKASNWDYNAGDYTIECLKVSQNDILKFSLSDDGNYYIVSGIGTQPAAAFIIPSTYNGLPVRKIGERAFYECTTVERILIPSSITDIGPYAFYGCTSLADVRISSDVANIGEYAFFGCSALANVKILNGVTGIGDYAFCDCTALTAISIPSTVTNIGAYAFNGCISLKDIKISDGVTSIGEYAFAGCTSVMYMTVPGSINSVKENVFNGCTSLIVMEIRNGVKSIGEYAFYGCTSLTDIVIPSSATDIGAYAFYGCSSIARLELPDSIVTIGASAFEKCTNLTNVSIGNGLKTIGKAAFSGSAINNVYIKDLAAWCGISGISALGYVDDRAFTLYLNNAPLSGELVIPDGVMSIGAHAFWGITDITSVKLPNGLLKIETHAFKACTSLKSINLPSSITTIEGSVFADCSALTSINIPKGVTSIGTYTFCNCNSLSDITLPNSVTDIGRYAFYKCTSLTSIEIPYGVSSIYPYTFYGCTSLSTVKLPRTLTSIGLHAFSSCTSLKSIKLPSGLNLIGEYAFSKSGLESIAIPSGVKSIYGHAFWECTSLKSISLSTTGTVSIKSRAFKGCTALTDLKLRKANISTNAFQNCTGLKNVTILSSVKSIDKSAFAGCTSIESMTLPYIGYTASTSTYYFLGYIFGASKYKENAEYIPSSLKSITLTGDSANLSYRSFYGCTGITSLTITDGVTTLPKGVFKYLTSLESISLAFVGGSPSATEASSKTLFGYIFGGSSADRDKTTAITQYYGYDYYNFGWKEATYYIPNSLKSVTVNGNTLFGAFSNCTSIKSVTFGENAKSIAEHSFYGCTGIKEVHMVDIGKWCEMDFCYSDMKSNPIFKTSVPLYYNGSVVTELVIPEGVTKINDRVFYNRTSISSVTLPSTLKTVGSSAFYGCTGITKVYTSDISKWCEIDFATSSASPLKYDALLYVNGKLLTELVIPDEVTKIGSYAFYNCTTLKSVTFNNSLKTIGEGAFFNAAVTDLYVTDIEKWCAIDFGSSGANPLSVGASLYCNGSLVTELSLSDGAESIGNYVFYGYGKLSKVTLPDSLRSIGESAFDNCSNLTSLTIGTGLETIGGYAFSGTSIVGIYIKDLTAWCGISGLSTFRYSDKSPTLYLNGKPISGKLVVPSGVTRISDYAFYGNTSITSVELPEGLLSICDYAFGSCAGITSVNIPDSLSSIGSYAFLDCGALSSISIRNEISIGTYSFMNCTALAKVSCPYSLIYYFYPVELTITSGNYDEYVSSQYAAFGDLTTLIIGDNVTSIGGFERQFTSLKTLYIGSGVTDINYDICRNRSMSISVSENNKFYKTVNGVLYSKDGKQLLYYPASKTDTSFTVPDGVQDIGYYAFAYCTTLNSITFPNSLRTIGDYAFNKCTGLTSIDFGHGVTTIGIEAFYSCTGLTSITIPSSVTYIKSYAFYRCSNMKSMIMEESDVRENAYAWYMTGESESSVDVFIDMYDAENICNILTNGAAKANYFRK